MIIFIVLLGLVLVIAAYIWTSYNWFVKSKTRIEASVQEIGNQLKRQADLIPNLIESVKGYMEHEKEIFNQITEARKAVLGAISEKSIEKMVDASTKLQSALAPIRAVFESNPQLQAEKTVSKLMDELRDTADKLMYSRRTLIDLTADYNIRVETFPSRIIAQMFSFKKREGLKMPENGEFLEVAEKETETPKVSL